MSVEVKICGIKTPEALQAATKNGARYVGFVFVSSSRRLVSVKVAMALTRQVPPAIKSVGLFVDPSNDDLKTVLDNVSLNFIQLHGFESIERVAEIHALTKLPIIKAMHIATSEDFANVSKYETVADMLMFDTKLSALPTGGTGKSFDWTLLRNQDFTKPWMLAGGINIHNMTEAVKISGARIVDLSSGAEDASGNKDPAKIKQLLELAASL